MTTLNARYGFKEPRSRAIQRPDDPLYRAFGEWLKGVPECELDFFENQQEPHYQNALEIVGKVNGIKDKTTEEVQNILLQYQTDQRVRNSGLFLSACYNIIDQRDLVWDLDIDTRVDWIGYKLGANKRLVLNANSGDDIGTLSNGLLVNYASVEGCMTSDAKGPAVNFGSVGENMAKKAKGNIVNFGNVKEDMATLTKGNAVNFGSIELDMAWGAKNIQANIAIKNPNMVFHGHGEICLDENEAKQHPKLVAYFEKFKTEIERYRNVYTPEVFKIFDVVERFVGYTNEEFMEKLKELL